MTNATENPKATRLSTHENDYEDYDWELWYKLEHSMSETTCKDVDWDKHPIPRHMINKYKKQKTSHYD